MSTRALYFLAACVFILSACDFFASKEKPKIPGKRIDVLENVYVIKPDESLASVDVGIPEPRLNENWRQAGGSPQGLTGNLQLTGFKERAKVSIGKGFAWKQPLYASPIIADGTLYAMDSVGYITAHDLNNIKNVKWKNKSFIDKEKHEVLGGGLAFDNGKVFVTSGRDIIVALDATTGKEIWRQFMGVPLRAAPKASDGRVYVVSVDNQTFAFDAEKGTQIWSHRGINENAGFLSEVSPAVTESLVIAPYSSGELHALDSVSGQDLWNDSLLRPNRTSATVTFSGIAGNPIVKDDAIYAASSGGTTAAYSLLTGRVIWQQNISSLNTPWIADDFLYMISNTNQLVCIYRADGRIKWVTDLPNYRHEKKKKDPYSWIGPIMAGGQLLIFEPRGILMSYSPKNGAYISKMELPEDITVPPIIAGGRMYIITKDATLHVLY